MNDHNLNLNKDHNSKNIKKYNKSNTNLYINIRRQTYEY